MNVELYSRWRRVINLVAFFIVVPVEPHNYSYFNKTIVIFSMMYNHIISSF